MSVWEIVRLSVALFGVVNCLVFMAGYDFKTGGSWSKYTLGRHMMGFIFSLAVAFAALFVALLWGPLGPIAWAVILVGINVFVLQRNYLLFNRKWHSRGSDPSEETIEAERKK